MKIWEYESKGEDRLSTQVKKDAIITYTKPTMAEYLISLINFKKGDIVMEPCKGDGAFFNSLPTYTENVYCEINEGIDYLKNDKIVDITLSNPPFVPRKLFWDFHIKAMQTTNREIYWLINISALNVFTTKRIEEMNNMNWYLENLHIVSDKRWFGRYVWCKFTRNECRNILTYNKKVF
jgi:hypothetical protein